MMMTFARELRHTWRSLLQRKAYFLACAGTLTLVLGANAAMFAVVNATMLRPLPFAEQADVLFIREATRQNSSSSVAYPNFLDWRARQHAFLELELRKERADASRVIARAAKLEHHGNELACAQIVRGVEALGQIGEATPCRRILRGHAEYFDRAGVACGEREQAFDERRLARAVRADQAERFARADIEIDLAQGFEASGKRGTLKDFVIKQGKDASVMTIEVDNEQVWYDIKTAVNAQGKLEVQEFRMPPTKEGKVASLLVSLRGLRWKEIASKGGDDAKFGLDKPELEVTVWKADGTELATLLVGRTDGAVTYVKLKSQPGVYAMSSKDLEDVRKARAEIPA